MSEQGERIMNSLEIVKIGSDIEVNVLTELEQDFGIQVKAASRRYRRFNTRTHTRYHIKNTPQNMTKIEDFNLRATEAVRVALDAKSKNPVPCTNLIVDYKSNPHSGICHSQLQEQTKYHSHLLKNHSYAAIFLPWKLNEILWREFGLEKILETVKDACGVNFGYITNFGTTNIDTGEKDEKGSPKHTSYSAIYICDIEDRERSWDVEKVRNAFNKAVLTFVEKQKKEYRISYADLMDLSVISPDALESLSSRNRDGMFAEDLGL